MSLRRSKFPIKGGSAPDKEEGEGAEGEEEEKMRKEKKQKKTWRRGIH